MATVIPKGHKLRFPLGTAMVYDAKTWGMYYNPNTNTTYLAYVIPLGTQIVTLPGHYKLDYSHKQLSGYVATRQQYACDECPDAN